jgi:hypothetical protein
MLVTELLFTVGLERFLRPREHNMLFERTISLGVPLFIDDWDILRFLSVLEPRRQTEVL